jgi:acyl-CoA thioester hydrolase
VHEKSDAGRGRDDIGAVTGFWRDGWFVVPMHVTFRDIDYFGHVNNAVYFSYFEWARTLLWFRIFGKSDPRDISFIVARAECDFKQQIELEPIEVLTRVGAMRTTSLDFDYEIRKRNGGVLAAVGKVVVVLFDWKTNAKTPISEDLRRKIESCTRES